MQAKDAANIERYQTIDIGDIPTAKDMQLNCLDAEDMLTVYIKNGVKGIVCFKFVWDC